MTQCPDISICIPAYEMGGRGAQYLADSFERIATQSHKNLEVIVSDQSDDGAVADLCAAWSGRFPLRHIDSRAVARQASANCNAAMQAARGSVTKLLFQDDFLATDDACARTVAAFDDAPETLWALCGSGISFDGTTIERPMVPRLHDHIHYGKNTVSSPSVLALRQRILFDENLIWLMDVDLYRRASLQLGPPAIIADTLIANRLHDGQVSAGVTRALQRRELRYVRSKFRDSDTAGATGVFAKSFLKACTPKSR